MWLVPSETAATARAATLYQPLTDAATELAAGQLRQRAVPCEPTVPCRQRACRLRLRTTRASRQLRLNRAADARATFDALQERKLTGICDRDVAWRSRGSRRAGRSRRRARHLREAHGRQDRGQRADSCQAGRGGTRPRRSPQDRRERCCGSTTSFPLTDAAVAAAAELEPLRDIIVRQGYKLDLGPSDPAVWRAPLFRCARRLCRLAERGQRRRSRARRSPHCRVRLLPAAPCRPRSTGCGRGSNAASRQAEARFFYASALRGLGRDDEYLAQTQALVRDFPDSSWSEEALNNLGTYYILEERRRAWPRKAFDELFEKFPERPARRARRLEVGLVGLQERRLRRNGPRLREAPRRRSRGRTTGRSFLYWAARSHAKLGAGADARITAAPRRDRLRQLVLRPARRAPSVPERARPRSPPTPFRRRASRRPPRPADPANAAVIRLLLASDLYDDAMNELRFAQRTQRIVAGRSTRRLRGRITGRASCAAPSR